jgi:RmlD substrate binding domain
MRAIVLGAGGQLGSELARLLGQGSGFTHDQVSVVDPDAVDALLSSMRPALVFNCAAYNAVDRAESEKDLAFAVNAEGPANLARACARHHIRLVHFSTNFVFDGTLDRPYVESDEPAPLSVYGASKLAGEQRVLDAQPAALVIRTSALFGDKGSAIKGGSCPGQDPLARRGRGAAAGGRRPEGQPDLCRGACPCRARARGIRARRPRSPRGRGVRRLGRARPCCPGGVSHGDRRGRGFVSRAGGAGAKAAQRLPCFRPGGADGSVARRITRLGGTAGGCNQAIKRLGPGDFSTPAPSLAAGGEVLSDDDSPIHFPKDSVPLASALPRAT